MKRFSENFRQIRGFSFMKPLCTVKNRVFNHALKGRVCLLLFLVSASGLSAAPGDEEVKKIHTALIREFYGTGGQVIEEDLSLRDFIRDNSFILIISLSLLIALLLFLFFRRLSGVYRKSGVLPGEKSPPAEAPAGEKALTPGELAQEGDFSGALLLLHRLWVHRLYEENLLPRGRDFTNREIMELIRDESWREDFFTLARAADRVHFRGDLLDREEYLRFYELYRSAGGEK